jgi:hypothetical protein
MLRDVTAHNRCGNSLMMPPLLLASCWPPAGGDVWHAPLRRDLYATSQLFTVAGVAGCAALIGMIYELSGGHAAPCLGVAGLTLVGFAVLATRGTARR